MPAPPTGIPSGRLRVVQTDGKEGWGSLALPETRCVLRDVPELPGRRLGDCGPVHRRSEHRLLDNLRENANQGAIGNVISNLHPTAVIQREIARHLERRFKECSVVTVLGSGNQGKRHSVGTSSPAWHTPTWKPRTYGNVPSRILGDFWPGFRTAQSSTKCSVYLISCPTSRWSWTKRGPTACSF